MKDRIAVVTGATSGIGRATGLKFLRDGTSVFAVGRDRNALDSLKKESESLPGSLLTHEADLTAEMAVPDAVSACMDHFKRIDVLV
ncbi:MAG: SDR family oxidoreductase, partial [Pyrinomonadaceae bacterium]